MNLSPVKIGLAVAGLGVAAATLTACAKKNEGKSSEGVANDYLNKYDKNSDQALNTEFELSREVNGSECSFYADLDQNGYSECIITTPYQDHYSIAALGQAADRAGDGNGSVSQAELGAIIGKYDTGPKDAKDKAIAGNNILERSEIDRFNKEYDEVYTGRTTGR